MDRLSETVRHFLVNNTLTGNTGRLLVAVSGGPDSVCLLDVLCRLRDELSLTLAVAHLNHNLRGEESGQEARFVSELSKDLGLEYFIDTLEPDILNAGQGSLQEKARTALRIPE